MKILHVYKTFLNDSMGGTEQVIAQLGSSTKSEHSVLSLSKEGSGWIKGVGGIPNLRFREDLNIASNAMSWSLMRQFKEIIEPFDLIHYHFPWPFADLLHLFAQSSKPSVMTYHSDIIRQKGWLRLYTPLMHYFLRAMKVIVATSPQYLTSSPVLQVYRDKTRMIPLGIDRSHYPTPSAACLDSWRKRVGSGFFLFVGMMRDYKGLPVLLEAMQQTNCRLVIAGLGPMEDELKAQALRLQLNNVQFVGHVSETDKIALLELCSSFVLPSTLRSEAFGVCLLEAAMLGKALISTDLGTGSSYVNEHGRTGLVVPANDVAALRQAMTQLNDNQEQTQKMGSEAARHHQALFSGQQMLAAYEDLYANLS